MRIKGAIFDMDGTIVDSLMFWDHLWKRLGEEYMGDANFKPSDALDRAVRTMIFTDAMLYFKEYYKLSVAAEAFLQFASDGTTDFYRNVAKPKEGARELLEFLKSKNIKLCLASATAMDTIQFALECYDMRKYFDFVLSCADIGIGKDQPDIYIMAKDLIGFSKDEICVFEDSYVALETAKKAGFLTVGIYDRYNAEQEMLQNAADLYLREKQSLSELIHLISV